MDVLIAATGFNTTFTPRFPIIGRNGNNLQDIWAENPTSYCGTGVSGFPNYMIFLGPNTPISNGSLMGEYKTFAYSDLAFTYWYQAQSKLRVTTSFAFSPR